MHVMQPPLSIPGHFQVNCTSYPPLLLLCLHRLLASIESTPVPIKAVSIADLTACMLYDTLGIIDSALERLLDLRPPSKYSGVYPRLINPFSGSGSKLLRQTIKVIDRWIHHCRTKGGPYRRLKDQNKSDETASTALRQNSQD